MLCVRCALASRSSIAMTASRISSRHGPMRLAYLAREQRPDGSWLPLWFGNQHAPDDINPTYGTARVLAAYRDLGLMDTPECQRGVAWLLSIQNADGGWGGAKDARRASRRRPWRSRCCSTSRPSAARPPSSAGLAWLVEAVESGRFRDPTPDRVLLREAVVLREAVPDHLHRRGAGPSIRPTGLNARPTIKVLDTSREASRKSGHLAFWSTTECRESSRRREKIDRGKDFQHFHDRVVAGVDHAEPPDTSRPRRGAEPLRHPLAAACTRKYATGSIRRSTSFSIRIRPSGVFSSRISSRTLSLQ